MEFILQFQHGELEELWEKLRCKVDEIRRFMVCDCGGKHERVLMEGLNPQEARYCARCATRHPAKQVTIHILLKSLLIFYTADKISTL